MDAWVGQPVEVLDSNPSLSTLPMTTTNIAGGVEVRAYSDRRTVQDCSGSASVASVYGSKGQRPCAHLVLGCDNLFYIRDGRVLQYVPTPVGATSCSTSELVLPAAALR
jgi:hypothetical protein